MIALSDLSPFTAILAPDFPVVDDDGHIPIPDASSAGLPPGKRLPGQQLAMDIHDAITGEQKNLVTTH